MSEIAGDLGLKPEDLAQVVLLPRLLQHGRAGRHLRGAGLPARLGGDDHGLPAARPVKHSFKPSFKDHSRACRG
ncbi:MAG: hypothetical protein MZV63_07060 [Marinilabiliales bacterium]|nr:hypothetical protein [Marinilabiliales bacterium]